MESPSPQRPHRPAPVPGPAPAPVPGPAGRPPAPAWVAALALAAAAAVPRAGATEGFAFFESEVRPILVAHCYECHSEEGGSPKGGLLLDRREGWQHGGDAGPALVPGDAEGSLLIHSVRYLDPDLQMPPDSRLGDGEIAVLERWVAMGAPDPRDEELAGAVRREPIDYETERAGWAYRPLEASAPPEVADEAWPAGAADRFLLAAMEGRGLAPAPDAEPGVLLRRLFYDLTGLPPTREEMEAFLADPSPEAYEALVDELLSRPSYGERWGRHWLDVARYADSNGADRNFTYHQAWRYRNYVIDAFREDKPYYQFVREQIAGDLLPWETEEQRREQLVASSFLSIGPKMLTERDKEKLWMDTVDEQLDTFGQAFLGIALSCARCHDHKFDPVSQEDYYALAGIFRSTEVVAGTRNGCVNVASWVEQPLPVEGEEAEELRAKVERLELAMRLVVEQSFQKKAGGPEDATDLPLAGVVYDDTEAELSGEWKTSSHFPRRYGPGYLHDDRAGKGVNSALFRGSLPETGLYEVRVSYTPGETRAERVPLRIEARDGDHEVLLDQTRKPEVGGLFQPVGRFEFEKGGRCAVLFETAGTEGRYVIVDAVQFIAVEDIAREAAALAAHEEGEELDPLHRMSEAELKKELTRLIEELTEEDLAMAPRDARETGDTALRVRGEPGQLGPVVPRGFPGVLHGGEPPEIAPGSSGRLELAEWLAGGNHALLDRVMVNRVWHHLFGRGLLETVDNFGKLGSGPSHPELLDHLALLFRESGGSVKGLVRELALSRAYRLSADAPAELAAGDPVNELFARQNRRRLSAEEIRDSLLLFSGTLESEPAGATATTYGVDLDKPMSFAEKPLRTVYLPVPRNNFVPELAVFDVANPDMVSGRRAETTVPTQALFLLNSDFLHDQAGAIARAAYEEAADPGERVDWLYETLLGRTPSSAERDRALALVADLGGGEDGDAESLSEAFGHLAHALLASTEFLYLD